MVAKTVPVDPFDLIVFGGTGDLARRKLLPALFHRFMAGQVPDDALIIGAARGKMTRKAFQAHTIDALEEFVAEDERPKDKVKTFVAMVDYATVDAMSDLGWDALVKRLKGREDRPRAFYLSVAPRFFGPICDRLGANDLVTAATRLVVEKPLGRDYESALALNAQLAASFDESQLYRIDHYLGKKRCRTSWRCALVMHCLNLFGIPSSLTMCRSLLLKASLLGRAAGITTRMARCGIWCRTI